MNIRALVNIVLPLCVLLVLSQDSNGLTTKKCNNTRLKNEIKKHARCLDIVINKYVNGGLKVYNDQKFKTTKVFDLGMACQYHNKLWKNIEGCNNELATNCFDTKMVQLANAVHSLFELRCQSPDIFGVIDPNKFENFHHVAEGIIGHDPMSYFKSIVTFDKSCNANEMADALTSTNYPCFGITMSTLYSSVAVYFTKDNAAFPGHISPCKTTTSSLKSCLNKNACFSQNEMDLAREGISTVYQWGMDTAVAITDNFGNVFNVDKALRDTTLKYKTFELPLSQVFSQAQADLPWFDELMAKILKTVDFFIKDFKNKDCKRNLKGIPKLS